MATARKRSINSSRRRYDSRKTRGFRSLIERLEERRVLANTITVNSTGDDTDYEDDEFLTLREALMIVNGDLDPTADLTPEEMLLVAPSDPMDTTDTIVF